MSVKAYACVSNIHRLTNYFNFVHCAVCYSNKYLGFTVHASYLHVAFKKLEYISAMGSKSLKALQLRYVSVV